jgi:ABC-type dipeptide/oligopeptide/nickel transport system permease component
LVTILRLLGRRLAALPLMILGITLLVFLVLQAAPGDQAAPPSVKAPAKKPSSSTARTMA